jgi:hypothetical protein
MSDKMRWRYGDTNPVVAAVDADTVIEIGDLVWQDGDDAKPASFQYPLPDGAPSRAAMFKMHFLGVAMQRSRQGDSAPFRVATTGVFEFDCPPGAFELGDLMEPDLSPTGDALLNQQVRKVDPQFCGEHRAIGRVAKRESAAKTSVLVNIRSTVMEGGVQKPLT